MGMNLPTPTTATSLLIPWRSTMPSQCLVTLEQQVLGGGTAELASTNSKWNENVNCKYVNIKASGFVS